MISSDTAIVLRFQPYPLIVEATLVDTKTQDAKRRRGGVLRAVIKRVKHRHKLSLTTSIINEPQTRIQISCETQTLRQTFLVLRFFTFQLKHCGWTHLVCSLQGHRVGLPSTDCVVKVSVINSYGKSCRNEARGLICDTVPHRTIHFWEQTWTQQSNFVN